MFFNFQPSYFLQNCHCFTAKTQGRSPSGDTPVNEQVMMSPRTVSPLIFMHIFLYELLDSWEHGVWIEPVLKISSACITSVNKHKIEVRECKVHSDHDSTHLDGQP